MQSIIADNGTLIAFVFSAVFGPAGATWLVLKVRLNGVKEKVDGMDEKMDRLLDDHADHDKRLYLLESWLTKLPCIEDPKEYWSEHARIKSGG